MKKINLLLAVLLFMTFFHIQKVSARGGMPADAASLLPMKGQTYYLAYNLHGDAARGKIYSTNYQTRGRLIPWGTEVAIFRIERNFLSFREVKNGRIWSYWFSRKTRSQSNLKRHVERLFIKNIEGLRNKVAGLSERDRDGIYEGRPLLGMSRTGILIAMGYPPEFANPPDIMTARDWQYWQSRYDKIRVGFNRDGLVSQIVD